MPLNMTMEEEHARVIGLESEHGIRFGVDGKDITHGRLLRETVGAAWIVAGSAARPVHNLELMPVQVEGVDGFIVIVDDDVDDVTRRYDERVDLAIDNWVGVVIASGGSSVQTWDLLRNAGQTIETSTNMLSASFERSPSCKGINIPTNTVRIQAEIEVQRERLGHGSECGSIIIGGEVLVILGPEGADDIRGEVEARVHHELASEVVRVHRGRVVGEVSINIQSNEVRVVAMVSVDSGDEDIVTLCRRDTQLGGRVALDVRTVGHDHSHGVRVKMKKSRCKRREANDADPICLPFDEVDEAITAFVYNHGIWKWWYECIRRLEHVLDERNGLRMIPKTLLAKLPSRSECLIEHTNQTLSR